MKKRIFIACVVLVILGALFFVVKDQKKNIVVSSIVPTLTQAITTDSWLTEPVQTQYTWSLVPTAKQTLSAYPLYVETKKDSIPHSLTGKEWVTTRIITKDTKQFDSPDTTLTKLGWGGNAETVPQGKLMPMQASGPRGGVYGYMKIINGKVQVYLYSTFSMKMQITHDTENAQPIYPYTEELRTFISDPTPIAPLFNNK